MSDFSRNEINLKDFFSNLKRQWKLPLAIVIGFLIIGIGYQGTKHDIYVSSALLKVEKNEDSSLLGNLNSSLGALSQFTGGLGSSESQENYVVELISSRVLLDRILEKNDLVPELISAKGFNYKTQEIVFNKFFNSEDRQWQFNSEKDKQDALTFERIFEDNYLDKIFVRLNRQTNFVEVSFQHPSPIFAQQFLDLMITELDNLARNDALEEAEKSLQYLELRLLEATQSDLRSSIASLIEAQLKIIMYANTKEAYLVKFIDKPNLPYKAEYPNRVLIILVSLILGIVTASISALARKRFFND
tara:strand:+ start:782 stop:1690 length:909 start_codon:yes stop_codon:yes gene_type:complete